MAREASTANTILERLLSEKNLVILESKLKISFKVAGSIGRNRLSRIKPIHMACVLSSEAWLILYWSQMQTQMLWRWGGLASSRCALSLRNIRRSTLAAVEIRIAVAEFDGAVSGRLQMLSLENHEARRQKSSGVQCGKLIKSGAEES